MKKDNIQYTILDENLNEIPQHFETNTDMVRVLTKSDNVLGSVSDFMFAGKVVDGGSFKDLKVSGNYRVRGLRDLPSNIPHDKTCILSVESVGEIGNPSLIKYELTTSDGDIVSCIYSDGRYSQWSSGGITIESRISGLKREIGNREELRTNTKRDLVSAINELSRGIVLAQSNGVDISEKVDNLSGHNHDNRYLKLSGGTLTGSITLGRGNEFKYVNQYGRELSAIRSKNGQLVLGNKIDETNIESSSSQLLFNGKKIVTEGNIDKVIENNPSINLSSDKYLALTGGTMRGTLKFERGNDIIFDETDNYTEGSIRWRSSGGSRTRGVLYVDSSGRLNFDSNGTNAFTVDDWGNYYTYGKLVCNSSKHETGMVIKLDSTDKGMGFYRNNSSKYLGVYNWDKQKRLAYFSHTDNALHLDEAVFIQGKRLWLQNSQPSGSHSVGDIWIG